MTSPIDTIREALERKDEHERRGAWQTPTEAQLALTQVEHQLADRDRFYRLLNEERDKRVAAETALAEANQRVATYQAAWDTALAEAREAAETALASMTAERDRLQTMLTTRSFSTTQSGANRIGELETALAEAHKLCRQFENGLAAAERRATALADALRDFEGAVRVYDVMLNEPAAEGLMSAEDYSAYLRGAWLGVEEAAVVARAALDRHTHQDTCEHLWPPDGTVIRMCQKCGYWDKTGGVT